MRISKGRDFYDDYSDDADDDLAEDEEKQLRFPERIVGRSAELERIEAAYRAFCVGGERSAEDLPFLLISGCSGSGKSKLVSGFRDQLLAMDEKERPLLLEGKYTQKLPGSETPSFSAILQALARLTVHLEQIMDAEERQRMISLVRVVCEPESTAIEPQLVHSKEGKLPFGRKCMFNYLIHIFQSLVRALCSENKPLLLVLDDLQWADQDSLDLIYFLLRDPSMQNFMLVSCVRSSCVFEKGLKDWLALFKENRIERIELSGLSLEETSQFIAETLHLPPEETSSLTRAVYNKTHGNIFSVIQAVEELYRKNIIFFSLISFQWEWNVTAVEVRVGDSN